MRVRKKKRAVMEEPVQAGNGYGLEGFLADPAKRGKLRDARRSKPLSDLEVVVSNAEARARSGEWADADARALVGLYAWCHRSVYGVLPIELELAGEFRTAVRCAGLLAHKHFADDMVSVVLFIKWSWKREKGRAKWAREKKIERNRMGWRLQFSARQVTDFLVETRR